MESDQRYRFEYKPNKNIFEINKIIGGVMNKRSINFIICFSFLFLFVFSFIVFSQSIKAEDNSSRIKKVISIVFDDSGSMKNDPERWLIANYTMQAYISLLNKDDQLYLTYISNDSSLDREFTNLTNEERQAAIEYIKNKPFDGENTYFQAVNRAYNKLVEYDDRHKEDSLNTEYSLIIITDGDFEDLDSFEIDFVGEEEDRKKEIVGREFQKYINTKFSNGSTLDLTYLIIKSNDKVVIPNLAESDDYHQKSINIADFNNEFLSITNDISGRFTLPGESMEIDGDTLKVESQFPLLSIGILVNQADIEITSIEVNDEPKLSSEKVNLKDPETGGSYFGTTFMIDNGSSSNIPSGKIAIKFNRDIEEIKNNIKIMFEPALSIDIKLKRNGFELSPDNYEFLRANDKITIEPVIQELNTGFIIPIENLPSGKELNFSYNYQNQTSTTFTDFKPTEITLENSPLTISVFAYLKDVFKLEKILTLEPLAPINYVLEAEVPEDMKEISIPGMYFFNSEISFYITGDGSKLNTNETESMPITFDLDRYLPIDPPRKDPENGMTYFKIQHAWPAFMNYRPGEIEIRASTPNGLEKTVTINLVRGPWYIYYPYIILEFAIPVFFVLFIIACIFSFFFKKRFPKKSYIQVLILEGNDPDVITTEIAESRIRKQYLNKKFDLRLFWPFYRVKAEISNLTFYPCKKGSNIYVLISEKQVQNWFSEGRWIIDPVPESREVKVELDRPDESMQVNPTNDRVEINLDSTILKSIDDGERYRVYFYSR